MLVTLVDSKEIDIAWAAGLIEGEGCFVTSKDKRSNYKACIIQVGMTDEDTILALKDILKVGKIYTWQNPGYKKEYRLKIMKQDEVFNTLLKIMPYLKSRRLKKASELFEHLEQKLCK